MKSPDHRRAAKTERRGLALALAPIVAKAGALRGWRANAWVWVLFLALSKGLISHAALAGALASGAPGLFWCSPGKAVSFAQAAGWVEASSGDNAQCLCPASGEAGVRRADFAIVFVGRTHDAARLIALQAPSASRVLPPPVRGPPLL